MSNETNVSNELLANEKAESGQPQQLSEHISVENTKMAQVLAKIVKDKAVWVEERQKEQALLDAMYDLFVQGVASERRLPGDRVRELATGEIYTATDAREHGLIDQLGDLDDAIDWTATRAGVKRRVRIVRPRRSLRDMLIGRGSSAAFGGLSSLAGEFGATTRGGIHYLYTGPGAP